MMTPVPKTFLLAAVLAWSGIAAAVVSMRRNEPAPVMAKAEASEFDTRWDDATELKKQDRLPLPVLARVMPESKSVEHILQPLDVPARVPPVATLQQKSSLCDNEAHRRDAGPVTNCGRHVERNTCTRHGKRKVAGRRGWGCR